MKNFENNIFLKKVLLSEKRILEILKPESVGNCLFLVPFLCILTGRGAYLPLLTPSTTPPARALPPPIVGAPSSF
jgi:hypothetical protein